MKEQIREMLMKAAGNNNTISYSEVGEVVGLDMANHGERSKLANTLDEINREEHERGRPLLSAVVVQKESGHPGTGFFESARELGKQKPDEDNQVFFANELKRVFDAWMAAGQQNKFLRVNKMAKREYKGTTRAGFINPNQQQNLGPTQPPIEGTDYGQYVYIIQCTRCGLIYGANGSDIWERKCPKCQGGKPGIPLPVN